MRILVFLLFLANLLFFAWTRGYFGVTENADAFRVSQQLRADQVRIVSNDVPPPETARPEKNVAKPEEKASAEPASAERCVQLAELPPAEADRLEAARQTLIALAQHPKEHGAGVSVTRYWKQGNVDYKKVPQLQGVDLSLYRGKARQEVRVTTD